jgi:RNA polymerase sigma-70 factor (ECF subfamily)
MLVTIAASERGHPGMIAWGKIRVGRGRARWTLPVALFAIGREPLPSVHSAPAPPTIQPSDEFERFFLDQEARISSYLWRLLGDAQIASDLCQETFLRAWQHFETIRGYDQPSAWLIKVATNLALHHVRRRRLPVGATVPLHAAADLIVAQPEERLAECDLVRETLLALAPKPRAMLVLREIYGLSGDEVAAALGLSRQAAKKALFRARAQFRTVYLSKEARP